MKYVCGPVPARRLGNSLGVDLVPFKTCTFDCVYCQLGGTTDQTAERRSFVPADEVIPEVRDVVASGLAIDTITLSGSGEPTLSLDLGRVIRAVKEFTSIPVAVLTNSSLLTCERVRGELAAADLVVPSFDAGTQATFEQINRPLDERVAAIAAGIREFTIAYRAKVWLEVMVVRGLNDTVEEAQAIAAALHGARLDKVQVNTVVRAPADAEVQPASQETLAAMADVLEVLAPVEIIGTYEGVGRGVRREDGVERILAALARRPCGTQELAASLGLHPALVAKHIGILEAEGRLERLVVQGRTQYRAQK